MDDPTAPYRDVNFVFFLGGGRSLRRETRHLASSHPFVCISSADRGQFFMNFNIGDFSLQCDEEFDSLLHSAKMSCALHEDPS
jgi:hypothetical protein